MREKWRGSVRPVRRGVYALSALCVACLPGTNADESGPVRKKTVVPLTFAAATRDAPDAFQARLPGLGLTLEGGRARLLLAPTGSPAGPRAAAVIAADGHEERSRARW